jgi:hypothetical protein
MKSGVASVVLMSLMNVVGGVGQTVEETQGENYVNTSDPLCYRLFMMPTGRNLPAGHVYVADEEVVVFGAGVSPTDFLQIDAAVYPPMLSPSGVELDETIWRGGMRMQFLKASGLFLGSSFGLDFLRSKAPRSLIGSPDFYKAEPDVGQWMWVTAATSIGYNDLSGHLSLAYLWESSRRGDRFAFCQAGIDWQFANTSSGGGIKLIGELSLGSEKADLLLPFKGLWPYTYENFCGSPLSVVGFRVYSRAATMELAWVHISLFNEWTEPFNAPYISLTFTL